MFQGSKATNNQAELYMLIGFLLQKGSTCWRECISTCRNKANVEMVGGGGNGNPLQYSCLENPMDGEAW